jgi:glycosyltransferase involved in cell wall biosynthesis
MPTDRIRVLQLIWRLTAVGGVPAVSRILLSELDPERFEAHALCVRPRFDEDKLDLLGEHVTVHTLDYEGAHTRRARAGLAWRMASAVRAIEPDIVHTHSGSAWMSLPTLLVRPRISRVLDVHDAPFTAKHGRWTDAAEMAMIRWARYHPVVHSSSVRADTAESLHWSSERVSLIPLGVQTRPRAPEAGLEVRRSLGIPATDKLVVYTGHARTKNVPLFLDVAREVLTRFPQGITFVLIGQQGDAVHKLVEELSPRLLVVPTQPSIVPALEAADVFLSTADYEGFGLAITEAMYTGVPVVSTAVGGVVDQVLDRVTGLLAPARDRNSLVEHTAALLTDDERRRQMGAAARRHVEERFTTARVVDDFEKLYQRLVPPAERHSRRRPGRNLKARPLSAPGVPEDHRPLMGDS